MRRKIEKLKSGEISSLGAESDPTLSESKESKEQKEEKEEKEEEEQDIQSVNAFAPSSFVVVSPGHGVQGYVPALASVKYVPFSQSLP